MTLTKNAYHQKSKDLVLHEWRCNKKDRVAVRMREKLLVGKIS